MCGLQSTVVNIPSVLSDRLGTPVRQQVLSGAQISQEYIKVGYRIVTSFIGSKFKN